jgi:hypothetical protein
LKEVAHHFTQRVANGVNYMQWLVKKYAAVLTVVNPTPVQSQVPSSALLSV